jgi:hypothetical protein
MLGRGSRVGGLGVPTKPLGVNSKHLCPEPNKFMYRTLKQEVSADGPPSRASNSNAPAHHLVTDLAGVGSESDSAASGFWPRTGSRSSSTASSSHESE